MQCASMKLSDSRISTACLICSIVDMPVDMMTGRPVEAILRSRASLVTRAEAILWGEGVELFHEIDRRLVPA